MILKTERLILRPFLESDAEDVFEYLHEPAVNCFACMKLDTLNDAKAEMKKRVLFCDCIEGKRKGHRRDWRLS